jgi:tetratricopeptide (TPR) repeat protein
MDPAYMRAYFFLGRACLLDKQYEAALAASARALELSERHPQYLSNHCLILGESGKLEEARECFKELEEMSELEYVSSYDIALAAIGTGEYDKAQGYLHEAYINRDTWVIFAEVDPIFDKIRDQEGFKEIIEELDYH